MDYRLRVKKASRRGGAVCVRTGELGGSGDLQVKKISRRGGAVWGRAGDVGGGGGLRMRREQVESSCDSTASSPSVRSPAKANRKRSRSITDAKKTANFKWPKTISRFFISFMADQARAGLKVDKGFKSAALTAAVKAINERFSGVSMTETNCHNHYRTLKGRWVIIKRAKDLSGVSWDEATKMIIMDDEMYQSHISAFPAAEMYINKPIDQYDEMAQICGDDSATEEFARSFGEPMLSSLGPLDIDGVNDMETTPSTPLGGPSSSRKSGSKRTRPERASDPAGFAIANGLEEVAKAISGQDWMSALYSAARELKNEFPRRFLDRAVVYLGKNRVEAQMFIEKDYDERKEWLEDFEAAS